MQRSSHIKLMLLVLLILSVIFSFHNALSCTRILKAVKGQPVRIARNMDWLEDMQTNLWVYPRGITRSGMAPIHSLEWTSKYGSIVATAYNALTTDGMNEKGLAAHLLVLSESDYGKRDENRPGLSIVMWAQYYLDNFQTVNEAVQFTQTRPFQLLAFYSSEVKRDIKLHLALEDATGDSAIIEYTNGEPTIYHHWNYTVVTNSPTYDQQLINLKRYQGLGGKKPLPGTADPQDRFVRAAYYTAHLPETLSEREQITGLLSILQNVGQPYDMPNAEHPVRSHSIWRIVADLTYHIYYFNSLNSFNIIWAQLDKFNLLPGSPVMKLDLVNHPDRVGDVAGQFEAVA